MLCRGVLTGCCAWGTQLGAECFQKLPAPGGEGAQHEPFTSPMLHPSEPARPSGRAETGCVQGAEGGLQRAPGLALPPEVVAHALLETCWETWGVLPGRAECGSSLARAEPGPSAFLAGYITAH